MEAYSDQIANTYHPNNPNGPGMPEWMPKEWQQRIAETPFDPKGNTLSRENAQLVENTFRKYGAEIPNSPNLVTVQDRELVVPTPRPSIDQPQVPGFKTAPTDPGEYDKFAGRLMQEGVAPESVPPPGSTYTDQGTLAGYSRGILETAATIAAPLAGAPLIARDVVEWIANLPETLSKTLGTESSLQEPKPMVTDDPGSFTGGSQQSIVTDDPGVF